MALHMALHKAQDKAQDRAQDKAQDRSTESWMEEESSEEEEQTQGRCRCSHTPDRDPFYYDRPFCVLLYRDEPLSKRDHHSCHHSSCDDKEQRGIYISRL